MRSTSTFRARRSARRSCTSDSDGLLCSFDIATQARLKFAEPEVFHLPAQITRFGFEALDAFQVLERVAIQLARVDQEAKSKLWLPIFLDHVLVAGHRAARNFHALESADPSGQHIDG